MNSHGHTDGPADDDTGPNAGTRTHAPGDAPRHTHAHPDGVTPSDESWDERYSRAEQMWSGSPNGTLVAEVATLAPGRALDIGCGEGADAIWLAQHGWQVTALDVSGVALERARRHAADAGAVIDFVHAGLLEADLPAGGFDLVSAQYPALLKTADRTAEHLLLSLVAPGGQVLVVHHQLDHHSADEARSHGFDPDDYVAPADVATLLGDGWQIEVDGVRERVVTTGAGAGHSVDVVVRARRAG